MADHRSTSSLLAVFLLALALVNPLTGLAQPDNEEQDLRRQSRSVDDQSSIAFPDTPTPTPRNAVPYVVPAAAFNPYDSDFYDSFSFSQLGGYVSGTGENGLTCLKAPVQLPDDATVSRVTVQLYDNNVGSILAYVGLDRVDNFTGTHSEMAWVISTTFTTSIQTLSDLTVNDPDISYPTYSYYLHACLLGSQQRLYSVIVYYLP